MSQSNPKNKSWLNEWEDEHDTLIAETLSQETPPADTKETK